MKTKKIAIVSMMTAVMCILGPLSVPLPFTAVPISFTNLVIYIMCYILSCKLATTSYLLYLAIGMIGIPVFSGFSGGLGKLLGPTGGYLIGFILTTLISSYFIQKWKSNIFYHVIGMILGTVACYLLGTAWLAYQGNMTFWAACLAGVIPFLIGDAIKIIVGVLVGKGVQLSLTRAGISVINNE